MNDVMLVLILLGLGSWASSIPMYHSTDAFVSPLLQHPDTPATPRHKFHPLHAQPGVGKWVHALRAGSRDEHSAVTLINCIMMATMHGALNNQTSHELSAIGAAAALECLLSVTNTIATLGLPSIEQHNPIPPPTHGQMPPQAQNHSLLGRCKEDTASKMLCVVSPLFAFYNSGFAIVGSMPIPSNILRLRLPYWHISLEWGRVFITVVHAAALLKVNHNRFLMAFMACQLVIDM